MMINEIQSHAAQVCQLLGKRMRWSYEEIKQQTGLTDRQLNMAIGWLACEKKIQIGKDCPDGRDFSLCMNLYF